MFNNYMDNSVINKFKKKKNNISKIIKQKKNNISKTIKKKKNNISFKTSPYINTIKKSYNSFKKTISNKTSNLNNKLTRKNNSKFITHITESPNRFKTFLYVGMQEIGKLSKTIFPSKSNQTNPI
jgi:gas vesicle protein